MFTESVTTIIMIVINWHVCIVCEAQVVDIANYCGFINFPRGPRQLGPALSCYCGRHKIHSPASYDIFNYRSDVSLAVEMKVLHRYISSLCGSAIRIVATFLFIISKKCIFEVGSFAVI